MSLLDQFVIAEHLDSDYKKTALTYFFPLAASLADQQRSLKRPMLIAINGCQGSGKSTLAALLAQSLGKFHQLNAVAFSIDDFYLTRAERQALADRVHPLLATRGVPGTHDIELLKYTLSALLAGAAPVVAPRFNKAIDDRAPRSEWHQIGATPDIIILEGWCVATGAQCDEALREPVNRLETEQDPDGTWRRYVNQQVRDAYEPLYRAIDVSIMLRAPSFDCVYQWRLEQEQKLARKLPPGADRSAVMNAEQVGEFISFYQRLTEHALRTLAEDVDWLYELDATRHIVSSCGPTARHFA